MSPVTSIKPAEESEQNFLVASKDEKTNKKKKKFLRMILDGLLEAGKDAAAVLTGSKIESMPKDVLEEVLCKLCVGLDLDCKLWRNTAKAGKPVVIDAYSKFSDYLSISIDDARKLVSSDGRYRLVKTELTRLKTNGRFFKQYCLLKSRLEAALAECLRNEPKHEHHRIAIQRYRKLHKLTTLTTSKLSDSIAMPPPAVKTPKTEKGSPPNPSQRSEGIQNVPNSEGSDNLERDLNSIVKQNEIVKPDLLGNQPSVSSSASIESTKEPTLGFTVSFVETLIANLAGSSSSSASDSPPPGSPQPSIDPTRNHSQHLATLQNDCPLSQHSTPPPLPQQSNQNLEISPGLLRPAPSSRPLMEGGGSMSIEELAASLSCSMSLEHPEDVFQQFAVQDNDAAGISHHHHHQHQHQHYHHAQDHGYHHHQHHQHHDHQSFDPTHHDHQQHPDHQQQNHHPTLKVPLPQHQLERPQQQSPLVSGYNTQTFLIQVSVPNADADPQNASASSHDPETGVQIPTGAPPFFEGMGLGMNMDFFGLAGETSTSESAAGGAGESEDRVGAGASRHPGENWMQNIMQALSLEDAVTVPEDVNAIAGGTGDGHATSSGPFSGVEVTPSLLFRASSQSMSFEIPDDNESDRLRRSSAPVSQSTPCKPKGAAPLFEVQKPLLRRTSGSGLDKVLKEALVDGEEEEEEEDQDEKEEEGSENRLAKAEVTQPYSADPPGDPVEQASMFSTLSQLLSRTFTWEDKQSDSPKSIGDTFLLESPHHPEAGVEDEPVFSPKMKVSIATMDNPQVDRSDEKTLLYCEST